VIPAGKVAHVSTTSEDLPTARSGYGAIALRAGKHAKADKITHLAQAIAFNGFLAIPSAMLLAIGVFSLTSGPQSAQSVIDRLNGVVPASVIDVLRGSLNQLLASQQGGVMALVGAVLALWSLSGAMMTVSWSLNMAYHRTETRGFVRLRATSVLMAMCMIAAVALVVVMLVLGPSISTWINDHTGTDAATWLWDIGRWPVLVFGLLATFASVLYLGPDVDRHRFRLISHGALLALVAWLVVSGGFAFYADRFAGYNKVWGSVAAVIVTMVWMWLSSLALLIGAELNAEIERSRPEPTDSAVT
jgi:membrane protein